MTNEVPQVFNRDRNDPTRYQGPGNAPNQYGSQYPGQTQAPYGWATGTATADPRAGVLPREGTLTMSFIWMFLALVVSGIAGYFVLANPATFRFVAQNYFLLFIAMLALSFGISLGINRLGAIPALALLFVYAAVVGATLSVISLAYAVTIGTAGVLAAFLSAASVFGGAALYGAVTRRDLTSLGGILTVGMLGLFVAILVNAFLLPGNTFSLLIGVVGVVIFTLVTAYDVQKIKNGELHWIRDRDGASVVGALFLYTSLINLFLMFLRIFGSSED